jgi:DNA/RNA endonuclease G (NUC1)
LEKGAVAFDERIVVFAGPVLNELDKPYIEPVGGSLVFIPSRFWKIIIWKKKNGIHSAVGFMQSQESLIHRLVDQQYFVKEKFRSDADEHFENMKFKNDAVYQVEIPEIEKIAGLLFDFDGIHLPKPKNFMDELTIGTAEVADKKYKGRYRSSGDEDINIEGMVLD